MKLIDQIDLVCYCVRAREEREDRWVGTFRPRVQHESARCKPRMGIAVVRRCPFSSPKCQMDILRKGYDDRKGYCCSSLV